MSSATSIRKKALESRHAIELLSSKWRITVLHILRDGPLRTGALQSAMTEVSPKVLTQTLRGMERDGLLRREVHSVVPPKVEYELTAMGGSLIKPIQDLCQWAKQHTAARDEARVRFDSQSQGARVSPRHKSAN